jgi:type II secretory pathway component PulF
MKFWTQKTTVKLSNRDKLNLISNLSTMLTAGIPILETVDALLEDSKGPVKKILTTMRDDMIQGKQLNTSFAHFPQVFDKVTVNIVKAAEEAGTLDVTLKDLKEGIKRDIEFNDKVKSALAYPFILFLVFLGVVLMMLLVVIPRIATVFSRLAVKLPLPTKIMIAASNALTEHTIPVLIFLVGFLFLFFLVYKINRRLFANFFFSFPLISNLVLKIDLARFSRNLHLLLSSGIPINTALELTQEVVLSKKVIQAINETRDLVLAGKKMSEGFKEKKGLFPAMMIKIMAAGEITGTLDKSMQDISEYLDYQVTYILKTLTTLLEPIMLVLLGGMVGSMMLAIITPIYSLISQVGQR